MRFLPYRSDRRPPASFFLAIHGKRQRARPIPPGAAAIACPKAPAFFEPALSVTAQSTFVARRRESGGDSL